MEKFLLAEEVIGIIYTAGAFILLCAQAIYSSSLKENKGFLPRRLAL